MNRGSEGVRRLAVDRYLRGESPSCIWRSLGRSESWFFKWLARSRQGGTDWCLDRSRSPRRRPGRTSETIAELVRHLRVELDAQGLFSGAQAIRWRMEELCASPLPSLRTIGRLLVGQGLVRRRRGRYQPKGKLYPGLTFSCPGDVHQADYVGPCYLSGGLRFYSLNSVDLATGRCAVEPVTEGRARTVPALWAIWQRLGMPRFQQVDNEMTFFGSPAHPRGMGKLIRLCLLYGIEPVFIPMREPWRNGVVEKFNDQWRAKFFSRVKMLTGGDLQRESLAFEGRHNSRYRYSKLGGKTPLESLAASGSALRFPPTAEPPVEPLKKPLTGCYHLVRFVRGDGRLDIFGEAFAVPTEALYEYVWATVDVSRQRLMLHVGGRLIDERSYQIR